MQVKKSGAVGGSQGDNYTFLAHLDSGSSLPAKATLSDAAPISASVGAANQTDWYKLDLKAGCAYEFRLSGARSGGGTLADSSLLLCTADGKVLENRSNLPTWNAGETVQSADPQIAFVAPYSGSYCLKAAGLGGTGSYTLTEKTDALQDLITALTGDATTQEHWAVSSTGTPLTLIYSFLGAMANTGATLTHANVFVNNTAHSNGAQAEADMLSAGQYGLNVLIHETGHALGLKHPGNYNVFTGHGIAPFIPAAWDNRQFSVMSYVDNPDITLYDQSLSLLDVAAIQELYGARPSSAAQTFYFSNSTEFKATVLSGSAAGNALDLSTQTADCFISLTPGTFSSVGLKQDGTLAQSFYAHQDQRQHYSGRQHQCRRYRRLERHRAHPVCGYGARIRYRWQCRKSVPAVSSGV